ncbi:MAG: hypothetical protein IJI44_06475 [Erysipelotrichaceae bacterium]|nr:hypothetical protein [Erysipelotrichaceae bacterium]
MKNIRRYLVFLLGLVFFGFGISLGIKSGFGNNPMGVFVQGMTVLTSLSLGTCNLISGLFQTVIGYVLEKKNVSIATFLVIFFGSFFIDLANAVIPDSDVFIVRVMYMLAGILVYCLAFSLQQIAKCGLSNYDCFIFGLSKLFKTDNYPLIRGICDLSFIVLGYLLGGVVGPVTPVMFLFSGKIIVFFRKHLQRLEESL